MKTTKTKPFGEMTKAQQRVAIAKDAIKQIRAKTLIVQSGRYVILPPKLERLTQAVAKGLKQPCQVCQIGQAIVCGIKLFNEKSTGTLEGFQSGQAMELVTTWFSEETAVAMEGAFENSGRWVTKGRIYGQPGLIAKIEAFRHKYETYRARSIAIWKNIITNNGEFIP